MKKTVGAFMKTGRKTSTVFISSLLTIVLTIGFINQSVAWDGDYTIQDSGDIAALAGHTEVTGTLTVGFLSNPGASYTTFTSLAGLESLTSVGGDLIIHYNAGLTNLTGLDNLSSVGGSVSMRDNTSLVNMIGLESLTSINGDLTIMNHSALTNLDGLNNITNITGNAEISYCVANSLYGLHNVSSIGGYFRIQTCQRLTNLNGLEGLNIVGGDLLLSENTAMINFNGLNNLSSVGGNVKIFYTSRLTSLSGLEGLTSIAGALRISDNNGLLNVNGLEALTSIGGDLSILDNIVITDLCALYNVVLDGANLKVYYNSDLSMETANALETQLRNNGFTGTSNIHDNDGTGLVSCETLIALSSLEAIPANGAVALQWSTESEIENAGFNIYRSLNGEEYEQINNGLIPAEGSPTEGTTYELMDTGVQNRKTYHYKLEDVDLNGTTTMHGPVSATPRLIYGIIQ